MKAILAQRLFLLHFVLLLLPGFFGCVSASENSASGEVIERSAEYPPPWSKGDYSAEKEGAYRFLAFKKTGLFRLELGIKQAQAAALDKSCELLKQRYLSESNAKAVEWGFQNTKLRMALERGSLAINANTCPAAQAKYVYWELVRKQEGSKVLESYQVDVLLLVPRREFDEVVGRAMGTANEIGGAETSPFTTKFARYFFDSLAKKASEEDNGYEGPLPGVPSEGINASGGVLKE